MKKLISRLRTNSRIFVSIYVKEFDFIRFRFAVPMLNTFLFTFKDEINFNIYLADSEKVKVYTPESVTVVKRTDSIYNFHGLTNLVRALK